MGGGGSTEHRPRAGPDASLTRLGLEEAGSAQPTNIPEKLGTRKRVGLTRYATPAGVPHAIALNRAPRHERRRAPPVATPFLRLGYAARRR
jgi:hypothetical protein